MIRITLIFHESFYLLELIVMTAQDAQIIFLIPFYTFIR